MDEFAALNNLPNISRGIWFSADATLMGHIMQGLLSQRGASGSHSDAEIKQTVDLALKYFECCRYPLERKGTDMALRNLVAKNDTMK
jgi:hypothetical protein